MRLAAMIRLGILWSLSCIAYAQSCASSSSYDPQPQAAAGVKYRYFGNGSCTSQGWRLITTLSECSLIGQLFGASSSPGQSGVTTNGRPSGCYGTSGPRVLWNADVSTDRGAPVGPEGSCYGYFCKRQVTITTSFTVTTSTTTVISGTVTNFTMTTSTTTALCAVPTISTGIQSWTGTNCASGAANVVPGTTCTITAKRGHTCTSPGLCGPDGNFAATGACQALCVVPTFYSGVKSWSGTNCASGAANVVAGTTCIITAEIGFTCTSPGLCGSDGNFAATGACQASFFSCLAGSPAALVDCCGRTCAEGKQALERLVGSGLSLSCESYHGYGYVVANPANLAILNDKTARYGFKFVRTEEIHWCNSNWNNQCSYLYLEDCSSGAVHHLNTLLVNGTTFMTTTTTTTTTQTTENCCKKIEFEGWPSGVWDQYAGIFENILLIRNSRPVYWNSDGKFLSYTNSYWIVGNDYQSTSGSKGVAASSAACPEDVSLWSLWENSAWNIRPSIRVKCWQALCTVPAISTGVQRWSGRNCASGAANVVAGTTCTITAKSGYTCISPGLCGSDGNFSATGACQALCTVPTISTGVQSWSGTNCASGAANVVPGTTCTITAKSGHTCTSPGLCRSDGTFAATGACQASCTVPTISTGVQRWSGTRCASGAANVLAGTTCTITAKSGHTCTSPGLCGPDGNFAATGACRALCTVPIISAGVQSWSGTNCASGAANVVAGTTCTIIPKSGHTCTSPGWCGLDGNFAAIGACQVTKTITGTLNTTMTASFGNCNNAKSCTGSASCAAVAALAMANEITVASNTVGCTSKTSCPRRSSNVSITGERKLSTTGDVHFDFTIIAAPSLLAALKTKVESQGNTNKAAFQTTLKNLLTQIGANYAGSLTVKSFTAVAVTDPTSPGTVSAPTPMPAPAPATSDSTTIIIGIVVPSATALISLLCCAVYWRMRRQSNLSELLDAADIRVVDLSRQHLLLSGRFNSDEKIRYIRAVRDEVCKLDVPTFMRCSDLGQDYGPRTVDGLPGMKAMAAFCHSDYGAKTGSQYETYKELEYAHQHGIPIFPVKLCDQYPPQPYDDEGQKQNKLVLKNDLIVIDAQKMAPKDVAKKLVESWQKL